MDKRYKSLRGFLESAMGGSEPRAAEYAAMAMPERAERVLRGAVRAIRKTAGTSAGGWDGNRAREVADELAADVLTVAPEWEGPEPEEPAALADRVPRGY